MATQVLLDGLSIGKTFNLAIEGVCLTRRLKELIRLYLGIQEESYYLTSNGNLLLPDDPIRSDGKQWIILKAYQKSYGGKGGFGTLIRAMGTQINKNASKGACRDLSGRRVRDVKAEKRVAKVIAERSSQKSKSSEKVKVESQKIEASACESSYIDLIKESEENIDSALQQGLKEGCTRKRKVSEKSSSTMAKKPKLWFGIDEDFSESDGDEEDESIDPAARQIKLDKKDCDR